MNLESSFKLHTDSKGYVWYATSGQPVPAGTKVDEFISNPPFHLGDQVKLVGAKQNVKLILRLYQMKMSGRLSSVQVCTPRVCRGSHRANKPEIVLMDADQWAGWPASLGGWHEFSEHDAPSYLIYEHLKQNRPIETVIELLRNHPAWPALSFISHLDEEYCAQLIATILDPRWYVNPEKPESSTKLEGFLGLNPKTQYHVSSSNGDSDTYRYEQCKLVLDSWKTTRLSKEQKQEPGAFLWRIYQSMGHGYMSDLRASQVLVSFLRNVWLNEIYRNRGGQGCDGLFIPEYFFQRDFEVRAFKAHLRNAVIRI